jgi:hypothetical protein
MELLLAGTQEYLIIVQILVAYHVVN